MILYQATVGSPLEILATFGAATGLSLEELDTLLVVDGSAVVGVPATELGMTLSEVNSGTAPGVYVLEFTPTRVGTLYIRMTYGVTVLEYAVQTVHASQVVDPSLEGDYLGTVSRSGVPIPGVVIRCYNSLGTILVGRTTSDSVGEFSFALPVGQYQLRFSKEGWDFSDINPSVITVSANDEVAPRLDEVLPDTAAEGDQVVLRGQFFSVDETEVIFESTVVSPFLVSDDGTLLLVDVPAGLVSTAVPVRVRKPDPATLGEYLLSNLITLVLS